MADGHMQNYAIQWGDKVLCKPFDSSGNWRQKTNFNGKQKQNRTLEADSNHWSDRIECPS